MIKTIFFLLLLSQFALGRTKFKDNLALQREYDNARRSLVLAESEFSKANYKGNSPVKIQNARENVENQQRKLDDVLKRMKAAQASLNKSLAKNVSSSGPSYIGNHASTGEAREALEFLRKEEEKRGRNAYNDCKKKHTDSKDVRSCTDRVRAEVAENLAEYKEREQNGLGRDEIFSDGKPTPFSSNNSAEKKLNNDLAAARQKQTAACSVQSSQECSTTTALVNSIEERSQVSREELGKRPIDCNGGVNGNVKENADYNIKYYVAANGETRSYQGNTTPCSGQDFSANEEARQQRLIGLECAQARAKKIQQFLIAAECKSSGYGNNKCGDEEYAAILKEVDGSLGRVPRPFYIYGKGTIDCQKVLGGKDV